MRLNHFILALLLSAVCFLFVPGQVSTQASARIGSGCLDLAAITAFAPRGEMYVTVQAKCSADDFDYDDTLVAYLEIVLDDRNTIGEDVRVNADEPHRSETFQFNNLELSPNQLVMVRLVRMGEILALRTIRVP